MNMSMKTRAIGAGIVLAVVAAGVVWWRWAPRPTDRGEAPPAVNPPTRTAAYFAHHLPEHRGQATVLVGERKVHPRNCAGSFQKVLVAPREPVTVELTWPTLDGSSDVWVQPVHGGRVNGGRGQRFSLKDNPSIQFTFESGGSPGLYQVLLRRGFREEALNFWVSTGIASEPFALR